MRDRVDGGSHLVDPTWTDPTWTDPTWPSCGIGESDALGGSRRRIVGTRESAGLLFGFGVSGAEELTQQPDPDGRALLGMELHAVALLAQQQQQQQHTHARTCTP